MAAVFLGAGWASAQPAPPPGAPAPPTRPIPLTAPAPPGSPAPGVLAAPPGPVAPATTGPVLTTGQPAPVLAGPVPPVPEGPTALPAGAFDPAIMGYQFWANGDYLLWRLRNQSIPSVASVLPIGLLAVDITDLQTDSRRGAVMPSPNTVTGYAPVSIRSDAVFAAGNTLDPGEHSGGRFSAGFWADPEQLFGLETSFFFLDRRSTGFNATTGNSVDQFLVNTGFSRNLVLITAGTPATATTPATPETQTVILTTPVFFARQTSSVIVGSGQSAMWGGEVNARCTALQFGRLTLGGLAGFRYLDVHEELNINNTVHLQQAAGVPPTDADLTGSLSNDLLFSTADTIRTYNHYYGGQVGLVLEAYVGNFFLSAREKIGVGANHQVVNVNGLTVVANNDPLSTAPPSGTFPGGLLSSPLDGGKHSRTRIAFDNETSIKLGYQFTHWLRGYVGYDLIYLTNVARPSDQTAVSTLNTTVTVAGSSNQVSVAQPTFRFHDTDFWAQGVTFGLELRY